MTPERPKTEQEIAQEHGQLIGELAIASRAHRDAGLFG